MEEITETKTSPSPPSHQIEFEKTITTVGIISAVLTVVVGLASFIGFVIGIVAFVKSSPGKSYLFGGSPFVHLLIAIFAAPIELILGSIELHKIRVSGPLT
jgi:hypothetical protein